VVVFTKAKPQFMSFGGQIPVSCFLRLHRLLRSQLRRLHRSATHPPLDTLFTSSVQPLSQHSWRRAARFERHALADVDHVSEYAVYQHRRRGYCKECRSDETLVRRYHAKTLLTALLQLRKVFSRLQQNVCVSLSLKQGHDGLSLSCETYLRYLRDKSLNLHPSLLLRLRRR
jgi:hypothetical protein